MEQALCESIAHINEHIKELNEMYVDGKIGIDVLVADIKEISETLCEAGEAREHVKEAHDYMKSKTGMHGSTLASTTANPGVRRGISVK